MWTSSLSFSSPQTQAFRTGVAAITLLGEVASIPLHAQVYMHTNGLALMKLDLSFMTTRFGLLYFSKSLYGLWYNIYIIIFISYIYYIYTLLVLLFFIALHTMCARDCISIWQRDCHSTQQKMKKQNACAYVCRIMIFLYYYHNMVRVFAQ